MLLLQIVFKHPSEIKSLIQDKLYNIKLLKKLLLNQVVFNFWK